MSTLISQIRIRNNIFVIYIAILLYVLLVSSYFFVKHEKRGHARVSQFCFSLSSTSWHNVTGLCKYNTVTTGVCSTTRAGDLARAKVYHLSTTMTWFTRAGNDLQDDHDCTSKEKRRRKASRAREREKWTTKMYVQLRANYVYYIPCYI